MQLQKEKRKLRVLFLADGLAPFVLGGMQQHSTQLVKQMAPLVESITLMHCGVLNGDVPTSDEVLAELGNPDNVEVLGLPFTDRGLFPGHYIRASLRVSRSFYEAIGDRLSNYDAVYAQGLMGDAFLDQHPKVMVNLHGLEMFQPSFSWRERLGKQLMKGVFRRQIRKAWRVVSLGGQLTDILVEQGAIRENIVVIPNAIESKWILSQEEIEAKAAKRSADSIKFVMVGRNEYRKGLHILQAAMRSLEQPIELHMIGDWPRWDAGIHCIVHHGVIRDKQKLMATLDECDVLLLPSLSEGMPTVVLEAAGRGLKVLTADVGAVSEIVGGQSLVRGGDALSMRMALLSLIDGIIDPELGRLFTFHEVAHRTTHPLDCSKEV